MKFEINPNELTSEQRNHVSDFIRNWPDTCRETVRTFSEEQLTPVPTEACRPTVLVTEEQRLDAEQKADLTKDADNLAAIFGQPAPQVPLDKEGLPWDSRIHSSSKAFIADGTWKLRRGVDPAEVAKVKAQLRELMAVPQVTAAPISKDVELGLKSDGIPRSHYLIDQAPVPTPPAPKSHYLIDQQPAVVTHNPGHIDVDPSSRIPAVTLTDLISRISKAIAEGRITQATVTEVCLKHQVSEFALLSNRPDLLPLIDADMKALGV